MSKKFQVFLYVALSKVLNNYHLYRYVTLYCSELFLAHLHLKCSEIILVVTYIFGYYTLALELGFQARWMAVVRMRMMARKPTNKPKRSKRR